MPGRFFLRKRNRLCRSFAGPRRPACSLLGYYATRAKLDKGVDADRASTFEGVIIGLDS